MAEECESPAPSSLSNEGLHPIFTRDPAEWMDYVYKEVCVTTSLDTTHTGWVYTIDPVSQSIVLVRFPHPDDLQEDYSVQVEVVLHHAVENMVITDDDTEKHREQMDALFKPKDTNKTSVEDQEQMKNKVKDWLCKNRVPVVLSGENNELLNVSDALFIGPPYRAEDCRSTNEIVLGRIQGLIKTMPKDIEDW